MYFENADIANSTNIYDDTQIIRHTYNAHAHTPVCPVPRLAPPNLGYLNVERPALGIRYLRRGSVAYPTVLTVLIPVLEFYNANKIMANTILLLEYLEQYPDAAHNSKNLETQLRRLFFEEEDSGDFHLLYIPQSEWFVYNGYWKEHAEVKIDLTQLLQTSFLGCVFDVRATAARLNVAKQSRGGAMRPRRKYLFDIGLPLSSAENMAELVREIRPYFLRNEPMGAIPMLLQLDNARLDLKTNRIRTSFPADYLTKMSNVVAPRLRDAM